MNWQDNPRLKAAALAGVASNLAYTPADRLAAALQALDILFEHLERQDAEVVEAKERAES